MINQGVLLILPENYDDDVMQTGAVQTAAVCLGHYYYALEENLYLYCMLLCLRFKSNCAVTFQLDKPEHTGIFS